MRFIRAVSGHHRSLSRFLGLRTFAASTEEYVKRNYARNLAEYNTVIVSLTTQRRPFLLRDVYDDMVMDGVQPSRDTFHSLIAGTMKGARLQDGFYFRDEMRTMGLVPDVSGSYIFGSNGDWYAIVRDMTAAGLGLNKFCYAGLIAVHKNKTPITEETTNKIVELVEQSKGWSSVEASSDTAENVMMGVSEEELYGIPTAEFAHRRTFLNRQLTVYHVAFHACADLRSVEKSKWYSLICIYVLMIVLDLDNGKAIGDAQDGWCYLHSGDIDRGLKVFDDYLSSKAPVVELYVTLVEGAMVGHTPRGMQLAQDTLEKMNSRGFFLNAKMGNELLLAASGEKTGGYTTANFIWDLMQSRKITPSLPATEAYYKGLKKREIPAEDPRLLVVSRTYDNLRSRNGPGRA
ncbi:hypothetical protein Scep_014634 [Stephania cephalantha]|uniref:Pentatricopeptide repeat-containing protein n=1 Tax=Stephania cephalantha TaxID=152367 RepID=A0AAP0J1P4_9MAGN